MAGVLVTGSLGGILLMFALPGPLRLMGETFFRPYQNLARLALTGLAGSVLILAVSLGATFAISTFPLVIFLGGLFFIASFTGIIALAYALGKGLFLRAGLGHLSPVASLLLGIFILFTLGELPVLGIVLKAMFIFLGTGVVISTRFGTGQPWTLDHFREG
jgi:hypothetical protein